MRLQKYGLAVLAVVLGGSAALSAQTDSTAPVTGGGSPSVVKLNVVAEGNAADGLQKGDLTLLDNGSPAAVESLQPMSTAATPTHVILVIDDVNARVTTIAYERSELKKFFTRGDGQLPVPFTLAVMTDTKTEIQPGFSRNGNEINAALQNYQIGLHEIRRDAQYGGFERTDICLRALDRLVQYAARVPGHKQILFVSPGWPLLSGPRIELSKKEQDRIFSTVARLQDAMVREDITLHMLNPFGPGESIFRSDYYESYLKGVKKPGDVDLADLSLQVLATHTGGLVQQGSSDIAGMVGRALADMHHTYTLAFTPGQDDQPFTYHALKLDVKRPGVTVRMPDEYYSPIPAASGASPQ